MKLLGDLDHGEAFCLERDPSINGTVDRSLEPPHGGFVYATINGESKYLSKQTHVMTTNQPSPLQNALQAAILGNGLAKKPTQMETIWLAVKDMQPVNYNGVAKRTKLPLSSVSSILCDMEKRGMIYSRGGPGKGPSGKAREYCTDFKEYTYLKHAPQFVPPKKVVSISLNKDKRVDGLNATPVSKIDTQPQHTNALTLVDALTVAQARELWAILNKMFGGK